MSQICFGCFGLCDIRRQIHWTNFRRGQCGSSLGVPSCRQRRTQNKVCCPDHKVNVHRGSVLVFYDKTRSVKKDFQGTSRTVSYMDDGICSRIFSNDQNTGSIPRPSVSDDDAATTCSREIAIISISGKTGHFLRTRKGVKLAYFVPHLARSVPCNNVASRNGNRTGSNCSGICNRILVVVVLRRERIDLRYGRFTLRSEPGLPGFFQGLKVCLGNEFVCGARIRRDVALVGLVVNCSFVIHGFLLTRWCLQQ